MPHILIKVARAARRADDSPVNLRGRAQPIYPSTGIVWVQLQENLESNVVNGAACLPLTWNPNAALDGDWRYIRTVAQYGGLAKCPRVTGVIERVYGISGEILPCIARRNGVTQLQAIRHGAPTHEGKLDGSLSAAGSATFSLYTASSGSWVDSTTNLTVYAPPRLSSGSIASGKWVRIYYEMTRPGWTVDSAEC